MDVNILLKEWERAANAAVNLSETYLTIGDISKAFTYARKGVELADRCSDNRQSTVTRATLANTLYHMGRLSEAERTFREAEERQKEWQPERPILYSYRGFQYCDLLLEQGKYQEVQARAAQTLAWATSLGWLLIIGLDCLSMGRAYLLKARREATDNFSEATDYLKRAVESLRQAGSLDELPRGLLAYAELYCIKGEFNLAQGDLDNAMGISKRGGMGLYEADCHLGYARLYLARGEKARARESWEKAREMIWRMGYHRRDRDVEEIGRELEEAGG